MKRWLAVLVLMLAVIGSTVDAKVPTLPEQAWKRALKLAQVDPTEAAMWTMPTVAIVMRPRYEIVTPTSGQRLCGEASPYFEGAEPRSMKLVVYVSAYVRPSEQQLLVEVLTHEMLHAIWFHRCFNNGPWCQTNSDSEEWVRSLIPTDCPKW